ncbi:unnamed protein product [Lactuca virosa]|uniref:Clp R domain-containing protein n=1 Tax=Lactuca virosa TaxID=75947 RepID=A0AAU9LXM2_9ASTR|nr:unnamed protein product [Lactuca virosa]
MGDDFVSVEHLVLAFPLDKRFGKQLFSNLQLSEKSLKDVVQVVRGSQKNDEVIWQVLRHKHCSYMANSCPLANSRYATIRDHDGVFYLYMKTIERAHMPNKLWERVKLPRNYEKALEIIDKNLMYWPKFLVHKAKQREKIMTTPRKKKKREARREEKAEKAAVLDKNIEKELLERLKNGTYGSEIVNAHAEAFNKFIEQFEGPEMDVNEEYEVETEFIEGEYEEEDDMEDYNGLPTGSDVDDEDEDDDDDDDDDDAEVAVDRKRGRKDSKYALKKQERDAKKKKGRVLVEVAAKVAKGELNSAFAIVRPPGHHSINKILIVDWDVYHGNGTQKTFYKDSQVLFFSIHRDEYGTFYPCGDDGSYDMKGDGEGEGYNINVPWENGICGDADYIAAWDHILIPVAREFKRVQSNIGAKKHAIVMDTCNRYL